MMKNCIALLFLAVVFMVGYKSLRNSWRPILDAVMNSEDIYSKTTVAEVTKIFDDGICWHRDWIDLYGLLQRALNKYEVDNFDLLRCYDDFLHYSVKRQLKAALTGSVDNLQAVYAFCRGRNIPFLFVVAPSSVTLGKTMMPTGMDSYSNSNENMDLFFDMVEERGIPYLDTRELLADMPLEDIFYKTDHHWALPASFRAFQAIIGRLNAEHDLDLDPGNVYRNLDNYAVEAYPDSLIGSLGIRVGSHYVGRDLFRIYAPKYETKFRSAHYVKHRLENEKTGAFYEAFIDKERLSDPNYNNKYNVFMYGAYAESRITNLLLPENGGSRLLFVACSFGRQLAPYMSQCFRETAWLDPQTGRYEDSYFDYIREFRPDCVVVLFNGEALYVNIPL